jgi:hypothetical protein
VSQRRADFPIVTVVLEVAAVNERCN